VALYATAERRAREIVDRPDRLPRREKIAACFAQCRPFLEVVHLRRAQHDAVAFDALQRFRKIDGAEKSHWLVQPDQGHAARRIRVSAIAAALSSPEPRPRTAVASLPRAISARPAARELSTVTASTLATSSSSGTGRPRVIICRANCSIRAPELSSAISRP